MIPSLPLPRRMIDYLNTPHYYSEHFVDLTETNEEQAMSDDGTTPTIYDRNRTWNAQPIEDQADPNVPVNYIVMNNNANSDIVRQS